MDEDEGKDLQDDSENVRLGALRFVEVDSLKYIAERRTEISHSASQV